MREVMVRTLDALKGLRNGSGHREVGFTDCNMYRYRVHLAVIASFRDQWLDDFYFADQPSAKIPGNIESALHRKLTLLHVATAEDDLKCPPGNRFEHLKGKLKGWCSVRVNKQYRVIFQWKAGVASGVYLDAHVYR